MRKIGTVILASKSPRREELLSRLGLKGIKILPSNISEDIEPDAEPAAAVMALSRAKAEAAAAKAGEGDIIIAADTIVVFDGIALGKPADETEAFKMLATLSGKWHRVYTGVTVARDGAYETEYEETDVLFRELSSGEVEAYIASGEPMDKAGAYGIQELGALLVERIEGDFYNVMGLPLCRLGRMLGRAGLDLLAAEEK